MVTSEQPQIVGSKNESESDLKLLTSEQAENNQPFQSAAEAVSVGAISSLESTSLRKAEMAYGIARQKFVDSYKAINHEKVAHNSQNLSHVTREADQALKDYDARVGEMNDLFRTLNIKERSALDGSMFDDDDKRIKLDAMMSEIGLASARQEIDELDNSTVSSQPKLVVDEPKNDTAA